MSRPYYSVYVTYDPNFLKPKVLEAFVGRDMDGGTSPAEFHFESCDEALILRRRLRERWPKLTDITLYFFDGAERMWEYCDE